MKIIPFRAIRKLVKTLAEIAEESSPIEFRFNIKGRYVVDKDGAFGLLIDANIPFKEISPDIDVGVSKSWDSEGIGSWDLVVQTKDFQGGSDVHV